MGFFSQSFMVSLSFCIFLNCKLCVVTESEIKWVGETMQENAIVLLCLTVQSPEGEFIFIILLC